MNENINVILGGTHGLGNELAKLLQANGQKTFIVAIEIYQNTSNQNDHYYEQIIERGSL